jgi:uncharacterized membrane protein YuzA (DUF378 family)
MRLPIVIGMYAFIVVFLPRNPAVDRLFDKVRTIDPNIAITISVVALIAGGIGLWMLWRQPKGLLRTKPCRKLVIINSGLVGIVFAAIFDVMQKLSGSATDLISLILVPIAFMIAEATYLALEWRLNRKFDKE